MKLKFTLLYLVLSFGLLAQPTDTAFFPSFTPYSPTPLIKYGHGLPGGAWNDPCLLKSGGQYIMYASASTGGFGNIHVEIYRLVSNDGYNWTVNPQTPVLEPVPGTYYEGGTETPSVVYYKGAYHMYTTSYVQNAADQFVIAHATSADGISWMMDPAPLLVSDGGNHWLGSIVGEPGAMIKNDTLHIFFTAVGLNTSTVEQTIGVLRSLDGFTILDTTQVVKLPTDVYPPSGNWFGLSTPSATMVGDTIYLFTDVAKSVNGRWYQAALHQFKSYGNLKKWYYAKQPIHTMADFNWTNGTGEYLSEIRSISPLMDGNTLKIWYAGNRVADIVGTDTTYHVTFNGPEVHADSNYWGMSTSEYVFNIPTSSFENSFTENIRILFYGQNGHASVNSNNAGILNIYSVTGQLLLRKQFYASTEFHLDYKGMIIIQVVTNEEVSTKKCFTSSFPQW